MGGPGAQPWTSPLIPGQNLVYTPRARDVYSTRDLREASMYDLARIIIENVEDQVSRLPISIQLKRQPGESGKDYAKRKPDKGKLAAIQQFIERPNADQNRGQFIRQLLDDMLTIDAASCLIRRNLKGGVYDFRAIDGAQIARYFDAWGATPQPPDPAYAQVWDAGQSSGTGIPWVDLTTDQLNYAMRNLKTWRLYGMSPLEQAIIMVRTGALRLQFQQDYYVSGSIPDAMQIVPTTISPSKLKESQEVLNAELSGILTKRRQIRLIQGFHEDAKSEQILFPKEALLKDEFDDYVIRCLCYAFGTSPQRLQRVMGMRSGQVNQQAAEKEGLEPWLDWATKCIWNPMVQRYLGAPEYEATYEEDTDVDPHIQAQIDDLNVRNATKLVNEVREDRGDQPYGPEVPEADLPMIYTPNGPVPLSHDAQLEQRQATEEAFPTPEPQPNQQRQPGQQQQKVHKAKRPIINPAHETPPRHHARMRLERALRAVFRRQKEKASEAANRLIKVYQGAVIKATVSLADVPDYIPADKRKQWVEVWNSVWAEEKKKGKSDKECTSAAFRQATGVTESKAAIAKQEGEGRKIADDIFDIVEVEFGSLPAEAREALTQAALSGINDAWLQVDISDTGLLSAANEMAADYARERAAEMVGMKYNRAGELVTNPNAKWAISDTTRDRLREIISNGFRDGISREELLDQISEADAFSDVRAGMIARTEVARAQVSANMEAWKATGAVNKVEWLAVGPDPCPICDDNDGEIRNIGEEFPSGDTMPLAHPNCYCILRAVLGAEED